MFRHHDRHRQAVAVLGFLAGHGLQAALGGEIATFWAMQLMTKINLKERLFYSLNVVVQPQEPADEGRL